MAQRGRTLAKSWSFNSMKIGAMSLVMNLLVPKNSRYAFWQNSLAPWRHSPIYSTRPRGHAAESS